MIYAYQSNQLEALAILAGHLIRAERQAPYLEPQTIVVQNQAIGHWLKLFLADQYHLQGNLSTVLPAQFLWGCFPFEKSLHGRELCDKGLLTWLLVEHLGVWNPNTFPDQLKTLNLPKVDLSDLDSRYQLALVLADLYEEYLIYRPDWILAWEQGKMPSELANEEDARWQAVLWRQLWQQETVRRRFYHRAHVAECAQNPRFQQRFQQEYNRAHPPSIFLFGLFKLSVEQWQLLEILSKTHTLYLFCHNASKAYWMEPVDSTVHPDLLLPRELHPLLEKFGAHKRIILRLLDHLNPHLEDLFVEPRNKTLLAHLQYSLLTNQDYRKESTEKQFEWDPANDRSLTIQVAHTPLREVEQLHQALLYWLQADASLSPDNILILATDVEFYAPFIESVFAATEDYPAIPVQVATSVATRYDSALDAWIKLLKLFNSRYSVEDVLDLLKAPLIGARYGINLETIPEIEKTLNAANIRWGLDGSPPSACGIPEALQNSWLFGIERMLLGYALEESELPFRDRAPCPLAMGLEAESIGGLAQLVNDLIRWREKLSSPRDAQAWRAVLEDLIYTFMAYSDEDLAHLNCNLTTVLQPIEKSQQSNLLEWPLLSALLLQAAQAASQTQPFLNGKATVCSLLPLHTIPFRVIAILGMDELRFPRKAQPYNFNCIPKYARLGDRNPVIEDRQLFLDAIMSAKECLYISYVGYSPQDNHDLLPATALLELIEYLSRSIQIRSALSEEETLESEQNTAKNVKNHLITFVPLSLFDAQNFCNQYRWPNFSRSWFSALHGPFSQKSLPILIPSQVIETSKSAQTLSLSQLKQFFSHPTKYFFAQHLKTYLPRFYTTRSTEPFSWTVYEQCYFLNHWLGLWGKNEQWDSIGYTSWLRGSGVLPHGSVGQVHAEQLSRSWKSMVDRLQSYAENSTQKPPPLEVSLSINGWRLYGTIARNSQKGLLHYTISELNHERFWNFWIDVLCYYASRGEGAVHLILSPYESIEIAPMSMEEAEARLAKLIEGYQLSIEKNEPIWLFPMISWKWVHLSHQNTESWIKKTWFGDSTHKNGEMHDLYLQARIGDPMEFNAHCCKCIIEDTSRYLLPAYQRSGIGST